MRTDLREVRRRDLERAAFEVLKQHGFSGTTVAKVAEVAAMSPGVVHFYFKNKEELLESAMLFIYRPMHDIIVSRLKQAKSPIERIWAVIEGETAEEFFDVGSARAWVSFFAQTSVVERYARIQRIFHRRTQSNLVSAIKQILPADEARELALELSVMIDAVWLRLAIGDQTYTREFALSHIRKYLEARLKT